MEMRRRGMLLAVALTGLLAARGAVAEEVQSLIPADALGYAVIHDLAGTDEKIGDLGELAGAPVVKPLATLQALAGVKEGLNTSGTAAVVVLPPAEPDAAPASVLLLPVTDYDAMLESLRPEKLDDALTKVSLPTGAFVVAKRKSYAIVAGMKDRPALERLLSASETQKTPPSLAPWIAEQDIALVVCRPGIELGAEKATQALAEMRKGFDQMKAQMEENPPEGFDAKQLETMVQAMKMYDGIVRAARAEVDSLGLGIRLEAKGPIRLSVPVVFLAEGSVASKIDTFVVKDAKLLAGLPAETYLMALGVAIPEGTAEEAGKASMEMLRFAPQLYGLNEEQIDRLVEIAPKYMQGMQGMSMVLGIGDPGEPLYARTIGVLRVENAQAFLARYTDYVKEMKEAVGEGNSMFSDMTVESYLLDGTNGIKLTMGLPKMFGMAGPVDFDKMMEQMYGSSDTITAYMVPANPNTIVFSYFGDDILRKGLEAARNKGEGLAENEEAAKTLKLLPPGAPAVGLWSLEGTRTYIQRTLEIVAGAAETEVPLMTIPEFPKAPPVGFSIESAPAMLTLHVVILPDTVRAASKYVSQFQQQQPEATAPQAAPAEEEVK